MPYRRLALATAVGLAVVLPAGALPAGSPPTTRSEGIAETTGDLILECRGAGPGGEGPPQSGPPDMDLVDAAIWFEAGLLHTSAETAGAPGRWFASRPESSAFVFRVLLRLAGGKHRINVVDEWDRGAAYLGAELDGQRVPWLVTREYDGAVVRHTVDVPPEYEAAELVTFDVTANVIAERGAPYLCDRFGQGADGQPAAPVGTTTTTPPPSTTTSPVLATGTPPTTGVTDATETEAPKARDDGSGFPWLDPLVLGALLVFLGMMVLFWLLRWRRRVFSPGGSHPAPPTPPPSSNEFGD